MLIATHNSATGEPSKGILSYLVLPFSKCQNKTIKQQYEAGCRMFDIRLKLTRNKQWVFAHGLWESSTEVIDTFKYLDSKKDVYVTITYEGSKCDSFKPFCDLIAKICPNIHIGHIAFKYTGDKLKYNYIQIDASYPIVVDKYAGINFYNRRWMLPIPWLWKKLKYNKPEFNNNYYTNVDFL